MCSKNCSACQTVSAVDKHMFIFAKCKRDNYMLQPEMPDLWKKVEPEDYFKTSGKAALKW